MQHLVLDPFAVDIGTLGLESENQQGIAELSDAAALVAQVEHRLLGPLDAPPIRLFLHALHRRLVRLLPALGESGVLLAVCVDRAP